MGQLCYLLQGFLRQLVCLQLKCCIVQQEVEAS